MRLSISLDTVNTHSRSQAVLPWFNNYHSHLAFPLYLIKNNCFPMVSILVLTKGLGDDIHPLLYSATLRLIGSCLRGLFSPKIISAMSVPADLVAKQFWSHFVSDSHIISRYTHQSYKVCKTNRQSIHP